MNNPKPSFFGDLEKILGKENAQKAFLEMSENPNQKAINQGTAIFTFLTNEHVEEIIKKYGYCVEAAFEELMEKNTAIEEEQKRQREIEERRRKQEQQNSYVEVLLRNFQNKVSKEEIVKIFNENNNDPRLTASAIFKVIKEREEQDIKAIESKKQQQIKNLLCGFSEKFDEIKAEEIAKIIDQNNCDVEKITIILNTKHIQIVYQYLQQEFNGKLTPEEIESSLRQADWNKMEAFKICFAVLSEKIKKENEQKQLEQQKQQKLLEKLQLEKQLEQKKQLEQQIEQQKKQLEQKQLEQQKKQLEQFPKIQELLLDGKDIEKIKSKSFFMAKIVLAEQEKEEEKQENNLITAIEITLIDKIDLPETNINEIQKPTTENEKQEEHSITITKTETHIEAKSKVIGGTTYSWIGFFNKTDNDNSYKCFKYGADASLVVDVPKINGEYEFRCFKSKYEKCCISETIIIHVEDEIKFDITSKEKEVIVSWKIGSFDPYTSSAYVTVHKSSEQRPNYYRRWNWIKTHEGSFSFKKPIHKDTYETRVYIGNELKFKSESIHIEGPY